MIASGCPLKKIDPVQLNIWAKGVGQPPVTAADVKDFSRILFN
jgi:hypothetical protein